MNYANHEELLSSLQSLIMDMHSKLEMFTTSKQVEQEWLSVKEAATYAGVSHNTLMKFRDEGLLVTNVSGTKRVSKKELDKFFKAHAL